jgi:hypothetical protein
LTSPIAELASALMSWRAWVGAMVGMLCCVHPALGATVYRWTDANGTVHFGDTPPPHVKEYTTESMPDAPAELGPPQAAAGSGESDQVTPAGSGTPVAKSGPARVVLTNSQADPVGPSTQSIHGTVKNEGGEPARDTVIAVVVTEPVQGAECLRDEIDVHPSTLPPGAEGTFAAEFENPCFHGPTNADLRAEWR